MFNLALAKAKQIKLCSTSAKINNIFSAKPWAHFIIFLQKLRWLSTKTMFISSWNYNNHAAVWTLLCSAASLRPVGLTSSQLGTLEWGKLLFWWIAYYFCKCQYRACAVSDVHSLCLQGKCHSGALEDLQWTLIPDWMDPILWSTEMQLWWI